MGNNLLMYLKESIDMWVKKYKMNEWFFYKFKYN